MRPARLAASVLALVALVGLVGGAVFSANRAERVTPTTTTSTTTTTVPTSAVARAIAEALRTSLPAPISLAEALCIADAVVAVVEPRRLEALARRPSPLLALTDAERDELVRGVVGCVPPEQAAAILGSPTTTMPAVELPDEDL